MATVSALILKDNKKKDGSWNVVIRITHKTKSVYIPTTHFVVKDQINKKFQIKDTSLMDNYINPLLKTYRDAINSIGGEIPYLTIQEIKERILSPQTARIDFIAFSRSHIEKLIKAGRLSSTKSLVTVVNSLIDYFKTDDIQITTITSSFLNKYEDFLRSPRTFERPNHKGKTLKYKDNVLSDSGVHNHMRDLRLLFNAARNFYNDEDSGIIRIKHYPFKKYKVGQAPQTEKRGLTIEQIKGIRDYSAKPESRAELARDLFMLSFYLCGMNAADMYNLKSGAVKRVNYNRSKTESRRKDKGYISIHLPDIAKPIYKKYAGKLQKRYSTCGGLLNAIDQGIKAISKSVQFDFDFYSARHSVGDIARNKLGFSKDDIALALNHKDRVNSTTDIYISKDWTIVDKVQKAIIEYVSESVKKIF